MKLWSIAENTRISDVALNQVNVNEAVVHSLEDKN